MEPRTQISLCDYEIKLFTQTIMEGFRPVLLGLTTTEQLWPLLHPPLLLAYLPLCFAPRWKHTKKLTLAVPLAHSLLYAAVFLPLMAAGPAEGESPPSLNAMESIFRLFADPDNFFCGWTHYLAFDLLVARGCAEDALEHCKVSNLQYFSMVVPCVLGCFYCGPVGFAMYMGLRTFVFSPPQEKES